MFTRLKMLCYQTRNVTLLPVMYSRINPSFDVFLMNLETIYI